MLEMAFKDSFCNCLRKARRQERGGHKGLLLVTSCRGLWSGLGDGGE